MAGFVSEKPALYGSLFDGHDFIDYTRELVLLSGKGRRRSDLLEKLDRKLKELCPEEVARVAPRMFERPDVDAGMQEMAESAVLRIHNFKLTQEQVDDLLDFVDKKMDEFARKITEEQREVLDSKHMLGKLRYLDVFSLYGQVIKNLEFVSVQDKRVHLRSFLSIGIYILTAARETALEGLDELRDRVNKPGVENMDDIMNCFHYYVEVLFPVDFINAMGDAVGTAKLEAMLEEVYNQEECGIGMRMASLFILLDLEAPQRIESRRRFAKEGGRERYVRTLMLAKLGNYYSRNPLDKVEKEGLENLIGDIVLGRGQRKVLKGQIISELRKRKQIADAKAGGVGS